MKAKTPRRFLSLTPATAAKHTLLHFKKSHSSTWVSTKRRNTDHFGETISRVCEAELRQLRKSNTEYEEQNAILSKHIDTMKAAIEKLEVETVQQKNNNLALQQHLTGLRSTLTTSFCNLPLPGTGETPSLENIDSYMAKLHGIILDNPQENEALISSVREIASRLEYQG
ncbi:high mobility group protein 20A [Ixodes scapularis]